MKLARQNIFVHIIKSFLRSSNIFIQLHHIQREVRQRTILESTHRWAADVNINYKFCLMSPSFVFASRIRQVLSPYCEWQSSSLKTCCSIGRNKWLHSNVYLSIKVLIISIMIIILKTSSNNNIKNSDFYFLSQYQYTTIHLYFM